MPESNGSDRTWWLNVIYKFGVPSAIALFLVGVMAYRVDRELDTLQELMKGHTIDTAYMIKTLGESKQLLLRICVNAADTRDERRACLQTE